MEQDIDHKLTLIRRSKLTMTGVKEVISFDENTVALQTCMGTLVIQGEGLQLRMLSVEGGQVAVEGTVESLHYESDRPAGSFLRRLFT
jgi:sporulation protein YabP